MVLKPCYDGFRCELFADTVVEWLKRSDPDLLFHVSLLHVHNKTKNNDDEDDDVDVDVEDDDMRLWK